MEAPPVQYATTSDGVSIAFTVSGSGIPLLFVPWAFDHVQLGWQYPGLKDWLARLSGAFQLVNVDLRGTGMSSRQLRPDHHLNDYLLDLDAVVKKLNLKSFLMLTCVTGGQVAASYSARHPDLVRALIMVSPFISGKRLLAAGLLAMESEEDWGFYLRSLVPRSLSPADARLRIDLFGRAFQRGDYGLRMRAAATEAAQDAYRANLAEAGAALPVLILQVKDYAILDPAQPGSVAQQAGAQLLLIPGSDAFGDADHGIQAIKAFVGETTGRTSPAPPGLSERELQVLRLIAHGQSNVQIARALVISPNTVQRHVSNILAKTSLANRAEAASYATRLGLVDDNN